MELRFTKAENEFRDEVRIWLAEHAPRERRPRAILAAREYDLAWQREQYDGGWAGIAWPVEYGGRGLSLTQQLIWFEEYARTGLRAIDSRFVGLAHAGPTLIARASPEQQAAHLPPILRGEVVWCQGFSEPEAGSDLASLRTRAVIDGDDLVVTGQKVWTSFAPVADWQELLVRTDPDAPKHKGITWVICDMHSPGIEVRPLQTIEGTPEFAEVFYDEVRIPMANVVGAVNDGWRVAMSTLSFERGTAFTIDQVQLAMTVDRLIELARERTGFDGRSLLDDGAISAELALARAEVAALRAMTYAGVSRNLRSAEPGPEGSMFKLAWSELAARVARLATDVLGAAALRRRHGSDDAEWVDRYLTSYSYGIGGGTSEIQRNIIAERVLGLPRGTAPAEPPPTEPPPTEPPPLNRPRDTMDMTPTADQQEIISSTAAFLAARLPVARTRALIHEAANVDAGAWRGAAEQGWFGLGLPEALGGVGGGLADEALLFRELGRSLGSGPFLATTLAARIAAQTGLDDLAARLLDGSARAGLAEPRAQLGAFGPSAVDGQLDLFDALDAEIVVLATLDGATLIDPASLAAVTLVDCIDEATRLQEAVAASVVPLTFVATNSDQIFLRGVTLSAAALSGISEALRDLSAEHARTRLQFGSPIGTNQAVKHPCADMHIRAEAAWSQTVFGALAFDEGRVDAEFHALAAKVVAGQAARRNAAATIQILGGMGYTFEHDAGLYMKRTHVLSHCHASTRWAQARLLDLPAEL